MIERVQSFGAELKIELLVESNGPVQTRIDVEVAGPADLVPSSRSESRTVFRRISRSVEISEQSRIQTGDRSPRNEVVVDANCRLYQVGILTAAAGQKVCRRILG